MPILSDVFGSDDSSNSQNSDLVSDLGATAGLDISNETSSSETDEDGSSQTDASAQNVGLDLDTDSLLGSSNDSMSDSDDGGLLN